MTLTIREKEKLFRKAEDGTTLADILWAESEAGRPENGVTCPECDGRGGDVPEDGPCQTCKGYGEIEQEDE